MGDSIISKLLSASTSSETLYDGIIDEFVDWLTGNNVLTNLNVTNGLTPSGLAIRTLLQEKLRKPFVMYEDLEHNLYKMFSSNTARDLYLSDPSANADLLLLSFTRPSDYELSTDISPNTRYLISGDDTQVDGILSYTWNIKKGTSLASDSVTATYTITDKDNNSQSFSQIYNNTQTAVTLNFYKYLKSGTNTVSVVLKGNSTGALTSTSFPVILLTLEQTSTFAFNSKFIYGDKLTIPYSLTRNVTSMATSIMFYIDGVQVDGGKIDILAGAAGTVVSGVFSPANVYSEGKHNLQIWAEVEYNSATFRSNILYFTFEVASSNTTLNYFINVKGSFKSVLPPITNFYIVGNQYEAITLPWGYYTDNLVTDVSIAVTWKLIQGSTTIDLGTINANKGQQSSDLVFIPSIYTTTDSPITLVAYNGDKELLTIPATINKSTLKMYETQGYSLKLMAYGKTNNSNNKAIWQDTDHNVDTTFTNINFDNSNGWYNNSLRLIGETSYATINYLPLNGNPSVGRTIEFEFESENVNDASDIILQIGSTAGGRIDVTPNSATLYDSANNIIVYTNFKANERVKLAFIINESNTTNYSNLACIVNNGVQERASSHAGLILSNVTGKITIGKSKSGIRFYGIRIYNRAISYTDAYNNWVFDSESKATIIANNNVVVNNILNYDLCVNKLPTVLIKGDLSKILNQNTDKDSSLTNVDMEYRCPEDSTKNFTASNIALRKHGQSTLNYPITSMKLWTSKGVGDVSSSFSCPYQTSLLLNKSRYKMKDTSIPANKFILQCNYADSSGVRNGGLERISHNAWYNAVIDGEYKLRTPPQLFATNQLVHHNNINLNEDGTIDGLNSEGKQWGNYFSTDFPHEIRSTPDSFPCVVFYQDTAGTNTKTFLGQYVFMEDKKSDFCYGERSIYKVQKDPFCLTTPNKSADTDENMIWDNTNVLRMEVLSVNSQFSSYLSSTGFDNILYDSNGAAASYRWEADFEMIYPDPDDLTGDATDGTDKFGVNSKYAKKVKPFGDMFKWLVSTKGNQTRFQLEAAQHLDLYKLAAYYIEKMRWGSVDNMERNCQWITFDGIHWFYFNWDMDIDFGSKNTGGIAFQPPMDRNTTLPADASIYAYSGRSGIPGTPAYTSNWLWDALEAWPYWMNTIVPLVAQALYDAGLSYDNLNTMFDEQYQNKWCEIIYNESGNFKYIESRNGSNGWLAWMQGASTTYRHWWLSVSMDYYDAKWNCGDFKNHYVYFALDHNAKQTAGQDIVTIVPNTKTYFNIVKNYITTLETIYATKEHPATYDASLVTFATKEPFCIYGATYIEELYLGCFAAGLDSCTLGGAYSKTLGAPIKVFDIGVPITKVDNEHYTGTISGRTALSIGAETADGDDALANIQTLNIRGQRPFTGFDEYYDKDRSSLKNVYAMGSGLSTFYSSKSGNKYDTLELPGIMTDASNNIVRQLTSIYITDSSWNDLTFWNTQIGNNNLSTFTKCNIAGDYTKNIPSSIRSISLLGTTCNYENSKNLILDWIDCIELNGNSIGDYALKLSGINWTDATCTTLLTYDQLGKLAQFNHGANNTPNQDGSYNISGYVILDTNGVELTAQQLTQIKAWFGDTVFNKNSGGLVVDHKMDYIQINVGSSAVIENNQIYLSEGKHAILNATKFQLGEVDAASYNWFVKDPNEEDTSQAYKKVYLSRGDDNNMYIYADESALGDYDVEVLCTSSESSLRSSVIIHIKSVIYPDSYTFNSTNTSLRKFGNNFVFFRASMSSEFYITPNKSFTATISKVTFNIAKEDGTVLLSDTLSTVFKEGSSTTYNLDDYIAYIKTSIKDYGLTIYSASVPTDMAKYVITAKVTFLSNKVITCNVSIILVDDRIAIIANDGSILFNVISQKYLSQYGTTLGSYYRSDLMALSGKLDFTTDPVSGNAMPTWLGITSLKTQNSRSIFKYLPNITEVILDGCANLPSTNNNINQEGDTTEQLVFDTMPNLTKLSVQNCSTLTSSLNLFLNKELLILDMSGTTINAILPTGSKLTTFEQGTPTSISILNPTQLQPANVKVDSTTNLTSLILANIPNTKTFAMLAKILNIV